MEGNNITELPDDISLAEDVKIPFKKDDTAFLVAKGKFQNFEHEKKHVKNLAARVVNAMTDHGHVTVRSIGKNATYSALKAIEMASFTCGKNGLKLWWSIRREQGNLGPLRGSNHVSNVSAYVFHVQDFSAESSR